MIDGLKFLFFVTLLLGAAQGYTDILNAKDAQSCMVLCASCEGIATFVNGRCECLVPEGNERGSECLKRLKRETDNFDVGSASPDSATSERSARCSLLGSRKLFRSADADRVAKYFMNGGPLTGSSLLGSANPDCSSSSKDQFTGASNPKSSLPVQPGYERKVEEPVVPKSPVVGASMPSTCANSGYQPIVSTQWLPNYGMGYNRMVGAPQPLHNAYYYPHELLGAVPQWALGIPNALMRATHIPAPQIHNPGLLGSPHHSPVLSAIASGAHGALQRLDNMMTPYASDHHHSNIVGAPHTPEANCAPSYNPEHQLGSPRVGALLPRLGGHVPRIGAHTPDAGVLHQVLAHQNTLLEALSSQLGSYSPHVGAPRLQYAPHPHMVGAGNPSGQCYCPDNGSSSIVGAANPNESRNSAKTAEASPKEDATLGASNPMKSSEKSSKSANDDSSDKSDENDAKKSAKKSDDEKTIVGAKEPTDKEEKAAEEKTEHKHKRESRSRSSTRRKRGDVKYSTKKIDASGSKIEA